MRFSIKILLCAHLTLGKSSLEKTCKTILSLLKDSSYLANHILSYILTRKAQRHTNASIAIVRTCRQQKQTGRERDEINDISDFHRGDELIVMQIFVIFARAE